MSAQATWYQLPAEEVFDLLNSTASGLSSDEVERRRAEYGYNEITLKGRSALLRLLDQFRSPLVWILLVAAAVTAIMSILQLEDMWIDTAVIMGVVIVNVIIGFYQEGKAETALEALKKMLVSECTALRDGAEVVLPTRELVPGDVVVLNSGDRVPADLRLVLTRDAQADEASLTGESTPVTKHTDPVSRPDLPAGDQTCMAFSGTFLTRGTARGVVVSTAENTEFGKIARMMTETHAVQTPLQRKIGAFTKLLVIAIIGLGVINFAFGVGFGQSPVHMFLASVALIVAGIPEMLPMIVTGVLAIAATAMATRKALIRRLPAAETLGCTTVICSDKTGTLTRNEMTVVKIFAGTNTYTVSGNGYEPAGAFMLGDEEITLSPGSGHGHRELMETLRTGYLCNNASIGQEDGRYRIVGDPTEGALVVSAMKAGGDDGFPRLDEVPFDSDLGYMATLHQGPEENIIYVKGSPERVLQMCERQVVDGREIPLDREQGLHHAADMAREALRVLAMASKKVDREKTSLQMEDLEGLVFLGLQGMIDPPRQEAIEAVATCKKAGIRVVMITGDHVLTAMAIARQLGITADGQGRALSGQELTRMSNDELAEAVGEVSVYARVAPEHKLRIAQRLQERGEIVAMTGDGVNDAPALKAADIGVAMGISGTEVSKEAASMVLTDDNFASIVAAVEEGRHAWKNLEKAILYTLPTNGGQALLVMAAILLAPFVPLFALRLPLEPIHILWINLADSVFLTIPLLFEPKEKGLLQDSPRDPKENIANQLFMVRVGLVSVAMAATGFIIYWIFGHIAKTADDILLNEAQTATFMAVKLLHLGFIVTARSVHDSAFTFNPFSNKWVLWGIGITIATQLIITYAPPAQLVFKTSAFPLEWWPIIILALLPGFAAVEAEKLIRKLARRPLASTEAYRERYGEIIDETQ